MSLDEITGELVYNNVDRSLDPLYSGCSIYLGNDPRSALHRGRLPVVAILLAQLLAQVLALLPGVAPMHADTDKVHPQLLALAASQPDQQVRVIIQHSTTAADMRATVVWLGGVMERDLSII